MLHYRAMIKNDISAPSRRTFLQSVAIGACAVGTVAAPARLLAQARLPPALAVDLESSPGGVRPGLLRAALAALTQHAGEVRAHDRIAIADFAAPSGQPRLHLLDLWSGERTAVLVAHGRGSDPEHTGWLQRFSNDPGSYASCHGAFLTSDYYVGKHGRSQRLIGLDPTNNNALARDIVIHSASYASAAVAASRGRLGRSEGCFAVDPDDLERVLSLLGPGRLLFAAKA